MKITKPFWPRESANSINRAGPPRNATPGYWYIRANYKRGQEYVGAPIQLGTDDYLEQNWSRLRDFLSDPTVSWKKDLTVIKQKTVTNSTGNLATANANLETTTNVMYELESVQKPVYLSANFSYRKHFQDKNPMKNGVFKRTDEQSAVWDLENGFRVRMGYIGFDATGYVTYHIPLDRDLMRYVEVDLKWAVTLRDPIMGPDGESQEMAMRMLKEQAEAMKDVKSFEDDDVEESNLLRQTLGLEVEETEDAGSEEVTDSETSESESEGRTPPDNGEWLQKYSLQERRKASEIVDI